MSQIAYKFETDFRNSAITLRTCDLHLRQTRCFATNLVSLALISPFLRLKFHNAVTDIADLIAKRNCRDYELSVKLPSSDERREYFDVGES